MIRKQPPGQKLARTGGEARGGGEIRGGQSREEVVKYKGKLSANSDEDRGQRVRQWEGGRKRVAEGGEGVNRPFSRWEEGKIRRTVACWGVKGRGHKPFSTEKGKRVERSIHGPVLMEADTEAETAVPLSPEMEEMSADLPLVLADKGRAAPTALDALFSAFVLPSLVMRLFFWSKVSLKYLDCLFFDLTPAAAAIGLTANDLSAGIIQGTEAGVDSSGAA